MALHDNRGSASKQKHPYWGYLALCLSTVLILLGCAPNTPRGPLTLNPSETNNGDYLYSLDNGGSIVIKAAAFPEGQPGKIILDSPWNPTLPANVSIIGDAIAVEADPSELAIPARVTLPLPSPIDNPEQLYIAIVDKNGAAIMLIPEISDNEISALLPALTSFALVRVEPTSDAGFRDTLDGKPELVVKETSIYRVVRNFPPAGGGEDSPAGAQLKLTPKQAQEQWRIYGDAMLLENNGLTAKVQAKAEPNMGSAIVTVLFINPSDGLRYLAGTEISISQPSDPQALFKTNLLTLQPLLDDSQQAAEFVAQVTDVATPPITWTWQYGDGETGGPVTTDTLEFSLPSKRYKANNTQTSREYVVEVTATDSTGLSANARFPVVVAYAADQAAPLAASINCPPNPFALFDPPCSLRLDQASIDASYQANVTGGTPPYSYEWQISPLESQYMAGTDSHLITFNEPGDYRLKLRVTDQNQQTLEITQPVVILGTPLSITLNGHSGNDDDLLRDPNNIPVPASKGNEITVNVNFQGGVLIASGQRGDYQLRFNWEDGDSTQIQLIADPLPGSPPNEPRSLELAHTYTEQGYYFIRATVSDASGALETVRKRLCVGTCNNGIDNTNTGTNRNDTTGYVGYNYGSGRPAARIKVIAFGNFSGSQNTYPSDEEITNADIQISGPATQPIFTWNRNDVAEVYVNANCIGNCESAVYGIRTTDDTSVIPSPLQYGRYDIPNTEEIPINQEATYPIPSPEIMGEMTYQITVITQPGSDGKRSSAFLMFAAYSN